ncbi:MAG: bifunctional folylpolyglutamate synthase/dihydrofolate synthase [Deltaproteobacteria bacterium]|nr:MAG: bifunctional folylpolyglutamate synthase/dihydrofolate synthase [Deltaproteobacteria bacterium]
MKRFGTYKDALRYLYGLQKYGIKFGLSKTENLMAAVGNPHRGKAYVHIAGTNGKGSVAAFLASILKEAGYKVGLYTSPHLVRFTERFKINGREISRPEVVELVNIFQEAIDQKEPPTFFELTTAMALHYFAEQQTDIAVMEVGMGGRLDATNIIEPKVTIISNIAMEHQFFLGNTLLDIAGEKAGIIKQGVPLVTGAGCRKVVELFRRICQEKAAPMIRIGEQVRYRHSRSGLNYYGMWHKWSGMEMGLKGGFQARNATLALAAAELLADSGFAVPERAFRDGVRNASWPGRMQLIGGQPSILLDGAHNPRAMRTLAGAVEAEFSYNRLIVVIGIMEDKDIKSILKQIVPMADHVIYTRPEYPRAAKPEGLFALGKIMHRSAQVVERLDNAIVEAREMAGPSDLILICGSLFTIGEALSCLDPLNYPPEGI